MAASLDIRQLRRSELIRVGEVDRTEHIDGLYVQAGDRLIESEGSWDSLAWDSEGHGEHSVEAKIRALHSYLDLGGIAIGALIDERLVGLGVVIPQLRRRLAQLAFLHVSTQWRGTGVGTSLSDRLDDLARRAGASEWLSRRPHRRTPSPSTAPEASSRWRIH